LTGRRYGSGLSGAVPLSHFFIKERLQSGDLAVDATCGNGVDTVLMAELVGSAGHVWGFDLQEAALRNTENILAEKGLSGQVSLHLCGHDNLQGIVFGAVKAVVFNLGYLPGGDHKVTTHAATTVAALNQSIELLLPGGIILVSLYTGHDGGTDEEEAVLAWGRGLSPHQFNVWQHRQLNRSPVAPYLLLVEKLPPA